MSIFDRPYIYSTNRLDMVNGPYQGEFGFGGDSGGAAQDAARAANYKYFSQGEAARTAYMNNFLGGGPAGPTYGGIVSGPAGTQGDRAISEFQRQWENPVAILDQLGINFQTGTAPPRGPNQLSTGGGGGGAPDTTWGMPSNMQMPPAGARLDARGNPYAYPGTNMNNMNPGTMMQPNGVMGQISNDFGWNPDSQPMMNNPGWGQSNDYWGNGW